MKIILVLFLIILTQNLFGQSYESDNQPVILLGVLNEKALILQMPNYPTTDAKVSGTVSVETKIDLQSGKVVSAKAISGNPFLRIEAEKAALQSKFPTILEDFSNAFGKGFLVYKTEDFNGKTIENKNPKRFIIIERGVVNNLTKILPKPQFPNGGKNAIGFVKVKILVDTDGGKVLLAKAVYGHPLLRPFAESAARETKFAPSLINTSKPLYVKASLLYKFNSDHTVKTNLTEKDLSSQKRPSLVISCGKCANSAIFLAKPNYSEAGKYVKASGLVEVEIVIDENGNVESADAVSGHIMLRAESVKAALKSKFQPTTLNGKKVKVRASIVYHFVL